MRVRVFVCPKCESGIFPRTPRDFRPCSCNAMAVAGPTETPKLSAGTKLAPKIKVLDMNLKVSEKELEEDWEMMVDEFGHIEKGDSKLKAAKPIKPEDLTRYLGTQEETRPENSEEGDELDDDEDQSGEMSDEEPSEEEET